MADPSAPLSVGTVLDGKWKIERPLGEGGMGVVYAATHVRNGLSVAIKVLRRMLAREKGVKERFLYEGYAANRVGHPGTVQVLDDGQTDDGIVYLVMERLFGEVVSERADRFGGALPLGEVVAIADAALDTLAAAHRAGIVHRDFKPENLFLTREGVLKVLDFGLARVKETTTKARLTVAGVLMGTPAFMPPEQAQANWEEVDARSDVYSVGASIFALATGKLVHEGATALQILVKVSTEAAAPLLSLVPDAPRSIAAIVDRALLKPREERWADAGAMLDALRTAAYSEAFAPASLREMASGAPIDGARESVVPEGPRSTEAGAPLAYEAGEQARAGAFTADPATPRLVRDAAPASVARPRAVMVDPMAMRGVSPVDPRAFAPTALPHMMPSFPEVPRTPQTHMEPDRRSATEPLPTGVVGHARVAKPPSAAMATVSPISSDAPTPRRRPQPKRSGNWALVVSAIVLGIVVIAFGFALVAFRNVFHKRPSAAALESTLANDERSSAPTARAPASSPTVAPSQSARPSASASASASSHHPVPSASAAKKR